jgi:hypothetical protein
VVWTPDPLARRLVAKLTNWYRLLHVSHYNSKTIFALTLFNWKYFAVPECKHIVHNQFSQTQQDHKSCLDFVVFLSPSRYLSRAQLLQPPAQLQCLIINVTFFWDVIPCSPGIPAQYLYLSTVLHSITVCRGITLTLTVVRICVHEEGEASEAGENQRVWSCHNLCSLPDFNQVMEGTCSTHAVEGKRMHGFGWKTWRKETAWKN